MGWKDVPVSMDNVTDYVTGMEVRGEKNYKR